MASHLTGSLLIKGEITGSEDLFIEGELQGKIRMKEGRVTVGEKGRVVADIEAREIVVRGQVKGKLHGQDRLQVGQTGRADGDMLTPRIFIEDGAEIHGRVEISRTPENRPAEGFLNGKDKTLLAAGVKDLGGSAPGGAKPSVA